MTRRGIFLLALAVAHYGPADFPATRQRLIDVYAEVYEEEAAVDPFFSVARFTDRLDRHAAHPKWSCAIGESVGDVVGYAYGRPDSESERREMTTVHAQLRQDDLELAVSTATGAGIKHPRVALMLEQFGNKIHTMAPRSQAARSWDEFSASRRDFA